MPTLTLSPPPDTTTALTAIFNHYGLVPGDLVSAVHTTLGYNEKEAPLKPENDKLYLKRGFRAYKSLTSPKLPSGTLNPNDPPHLWPPRPTQSIPEATTTASSTQVVTQESPMSITHQIITVSGYKPTPTVKDPNAETEVILEGPITTARTSEQTALNVQDWIVNNIPKITESGVRPSSITITHSTLPRT